MLITDKSYSDLKDSLMKTVRVFGLRTVRGSAAGSALIRDTSFSQIWNLYEFHFMDVFMMMISDTYGTTFLGTGKLKQLMSLMSSLVGDRLHDEDFFVNLSAETVCNEFRYTEYEKDVDFITEIVSIREGRVESSALLSSTLIRDNPPYTCYRRKP